MPGRSGAAEGFPGPHPVPAVLALVHRLFAIFPQAVILAVTRLRLCALQETFGKVSREAFGGELLCLAPPLLKRLGAVGHGGLFGSLLRPGAPAGKQHDANQRERQNRSDHKTPFPPAFTNPVDGQSLQQTSEAAEAASPMPCSQKVTDRSSATASSHRLRQRRIRLDEELRNVRRTNEDRVRIE